MSQLELALKKARAMEAAALGRHPGVDPQSRVASWAFRSPWEFDGSETDRPETSDEEASPAPQEVRSKARKLATLPDAAATSGKPATPVRFRDFDVAVRRKLVVGEQALPELREQFRKVAATLYGLQAERQQNIVMIVSAGPGEGKTLTATNLALTLSESYRSRVLLVDADLRRPSVHKLFDITNDIGLKEGLTTDSDAKFSTIRISPRLEVVTAGSAPVDPMGALTSELLRMKLEEAARTFDWVVLDTPPVGLLPDAKILAGLADLAVLVVEAGVTRCELAQRAIEAIGRDRVVGAVLNQLPATRFTRYREYRYDNETQAIQHS
jgi:capsular exopolysaccharide synthesis family protein